MWKSKSFWGGITGLVGALAGWMTGEIELGSAISIATTSILAIFLRHGIAKTQDAAEDAAEAAADAASAPVPAPKKKVVKKAI